VLDSRHGTGAHRAKVGQRRRVDVKVAGVRGVPGDATAVVLNLAAINASTASYLTAFPAGEALPYASNLDFGRNQTLANLVVVRIGTGGKVSIFNGIGSTDVVADVMGYFPGGSDRYTAVTPFRQLDTRRGVGSPRAKVGAGRRIDVKLAGVGAVPADANAVVLNLAAINGSAASSLTVYPTGTTARPSPSLYFAKGRTTAILVVVPVGEGGKVSFYNASGSTDVVADVMGWFPNPN
jgi:hypothetical protein